MELNMIASGIRLIGSTIKNLKVDNNIVDVDKECKRSFGLNINEENKKSILDAIESIRLKCDIYEAYIDENNFYVQYRKIDGA